MDTGLAKQLKVVLDTQRRRAEEAERELEAGRAADAERRARAGRKPARHKD